MKLISGAFICIAAFLSCTNNKKMTGSQNSLPVATSVVNLDKQGHRGCRGLLPENTVPAMLRALDLGVTTLEMDIVFTKDMVPVLSHEPFFNHEITTLPDGKFISEKDEKQYNIYAMDFATVQQYDVGLKTHPRFPQQQKIAVHKPGLQEVFEAVKLYMSKSKRPFPYFNIETKTTAATDDVYHPAPAVFVDRLMALIQQQGMEQWVMIQSFDIRTLQYLHTNYPEIKTVLLIEDFDQRNVEEQIAALGFMPDVYSPHYSLVTSSLLHFFHQQKKKVIPWTVNEKEKIMELINAGVDGIITDYPDLLPL